jgi:AraC-like DNA-binding protein
MEKPPVSAINSRKQATPKALGAEGGALILGAPWSSHDAGSVCAELTGVVVRLARLDATRAADAIRVCDCTGNDGGLTCHIAELCLRSAQEALRSQACSQSRTIRYRCPCGVPCACIVLGNGPAEGASFIWARACATARAEQKPCLSDHNASAFARSDCCDDAPFDVAVDLLSVMGDSVMEAARDRKPVQRGTQRLTQHQKILARHLCQVIHARWGDANLRLGQLAGENGVSVAYLCTLFRRAVGAPFRQYLQAWRMRKVREWLTEDVRSIKEIAQHAGFNDPNRLRLAFKAATGLSPREWREQRLSMLALGKFDELK